MDPESTARGRYPKAYQGFSMLFQLDRCEAKFWCSITRVLLEGFGVFRTLPNGVWAQEAAFFSVPPAGCATGGGERTVPQNTTDSNGFRTESPSGFSLSSTRVRGLVD